MSLSSAASFSYDGVDFSGASYGLYVVKHNAPRLPKPRVHMMELSQGDGAVVQGSTVGSRVFRFGCVGVATSEALRETQVENVIGVLQGSLTGAKWLILGWKNDVKWKAVLTSGVDGDTAILGEEFSLEFLAPNPASVAV